MDSEDILYIVDMKILEITYVSPKPFFKFRVESMDFLELLDKRNINI